MEELLSYGVWGVAPSWHMGTFINLKVPLALEILWKFHYVDMIEQIIGHW